MREPVGCFAATSFAFGAGATSGRGPSRYIRAGPRLLSDAWMTMTASLSVTMWFECEETPPHVKRYHNTMVKNFDLDNDAASERVQRSSSGSGGRGEVADG